MRVPTIAAAAMLFYAVGAGAGPTVQPGLYEVTNKLTAITARDLPPGMAKLLTSQPTERRKVCVSPKGSAELHKAVMLNSEGCPKEQNASGAGRIAVVAREGQCVAPLKFRIDGTYKASEFAFTVFSETPEGTTTWAYAGKRVGTCTW